MKYFLLFLIIPVVFFSFQFASSPVSSDTVLKDFIINQGDGLNIISTRLQQNRLIRTKYVFLLLAHQLKLNDKLQAGQFKLSPSMSTSQIITKLSSGGRNDYWLKIIEGQRIEEIHPTFDKSLEGYLFPDSYLIPQDYTQEQIITIINKNFLEKLADAKLNAVNTQMSDSQIIILASLLEREARTLISKQTIAGIILNRLKIGMALQIDATVQYARDTRVKPKVFWTPISKTNLSINSPFNTYKNPGLPPSPICNPGYDSIYAAYHPVDSDYMYYITDSDGQMHYAKTLSEHNLNVAKYLR